jgi:hypothetical protein
MRYLDAIDSAIPREGPRGPEDNDAPVRALAMSKFDRYVRSFGCNNERDKLIDDKTTALHAAFLIAAEESTRVYASIECIRVEKFTTSCGVPIKDVDRVGSRKQPC